MKKHIPNFITSLNLLCGGLAIYSLINNPLHSIIFFALCLVFDFCDGLFARILSVQSEFGKQMDSLADLISFGFFPAAICAYFFHIEFGILFQTNPSARILILTIGLLILVFSALRLAKFNIKAESKNFIGLPTPANAVFWVGLLCLQLHAPEFFNRIPNVEFFIIALIIIFSLLLVSKINLFSFKFSHFKWKGNEMRFLFIIMVIILAVWLKFVALAPIIVVYIIWSIISNKIWKWSLPQK